MLNILLDRSSEEGLHMATETEMKFQIWKHMRRLLCNTQPK